MKTHKLTVTITANCTAAEAKAYVQEAVNAWDNSYPTDDPFFGDNKRVEVKHFRQPRKPQPEIRYVDPRYLP